MAETINYNYSAPTKSIWLKLKNNGESCKIRIVSDPVKYLSTYQDKTAEKYAWLVIDRADEVIKVFVVGKQIWDKVAALAKNEDWGDPMTYDLTVTRVGTSPSNFYDVSPSPNNRGALTTVEEGLVMACDIDLAKAVEEKKKDN